MSRRRWTEEEISRLRAFYASDASLDRLSAAFPDRTLHAIRQKASRLGLRRMISQPQPPSSPILLCRGEGASEGLLLRCSNCGAWIRVTLDGGPGNDKIRCRDCGYIIHLAE
jgi:predicted Zn finger-like uncharacterized protein